MAYDITQVKLIYDELTTKVKADLDEQFNSGRLKGSDYAQVYAKLMAECLQLAFESPLKEQQVTSMRNKDAIENAQSAKDLQLKDKEMALKAQQIVSMQNKDAIEAAQSNKDLALKDKEIALRDSEIATQNRQRQGFDDNMKLKMLETQLNAWSMMFSSGMLSTSPTIITNDEATTLYNNLKAELGI